MSNPSRAPDGPPAGTGPEARFRAVWDDAYADVLRFVQRRVPPARAEDVVADAFLVVWRRLPDLPRDPDDARAWIFGIARRLLLAEHRLAARHESLAVRLREPTTRDTAADAAPDEVLTRLDVVRAWPRLSATHQEALALHLLDELDAPRAAQVLGVSPVAYRLRLSRARRALRAHLTHLPTSPTTPSSTPSTPAAPRAAGRTSDA